MKANQAFAPGKKGPERRRSAFSRAACKTRSAPRRDATERKRRGKRIQLNSVLFVSRFYRRQSRGCSNRVTEAPDLNSQNKQGYRKKIKLPSGGEKPSNGGEEEKVQGESECESERWALQHPITPPAQVLRSSGPQVFRSSGPQVLRSSGTQVFRSSGPHVFR